VQLHWILFRSTDPPASLARLCATSRASHADRALDVSLCLVTISALFVNRCPITCTWDESGTPKPSARLATLGTTTWARNGDHGHGHAKPASRLARHRHHVSVPLVKGTAPVEPHERLFSSSWHARCSYPVDTPDRSDLESHHGKKILSGQRNSQRSNGPMYTDPQIIARSPTSYAARQNRSPHLRSPT
jgi:hypothetical protein